MSEIHNHGFIFHNLYLMFITSYVTFDFESHNFAVESQTQLL